MPRAPSQKLNHASAAAGHPYAITANPDTSQSVPTPSASAAHSPHSQQPRLNNSPPPHMSSLLPPQQSHSSLQGPEQQQGFREEDASSRFRQPSPRDNPLLAQTQPPNGSKSTVDQGNQQMNSSHDSITKTSGDEPSSSIEQLRALPNGNASSALAPASASGSSSTPANASGPTSGASGGAGTKKKHVCPTCDRAFTTSGHLARHARVHTGERNHKCPFPGCETRCSRQDNLQQHYRIHLSPGSRRSSSSATRAAIRASCAKPMATTAAIPAPPDLDSPPPLAQATFPAASLPSHIQYTAVHQHYPPQAVTLPQAHVPSPHIEQQSYQPQTPPVTNGHAYENGNGSGLAADVPRGYGHGHPDSPGGNSGPASATPSADASPVIGGPGSVPSGSQTYPTHHQTYIYVQHPGYYTHPQHTTSGPQTPGPATYTAPSPSSGLDNQYSNQPQISNFYQQHHYPREAYINSPQASTGPLAHTPPNYASQNPLPQHTHNQGYIEPPKGKAKRRGRMSDGSVTNGGQSPSDSPVVGNTQGQTNNRSNGQGHSNVYAYYGMSAPASSGNAVPPSSGGIAGIPPPSSASSQGNTRYSAGGNGGAFGQFQLHNTPPPPPPLTSSSSVTTASAVSYASTHTSYPDQNVELNNNDVSGNGTHSPPPVLAPIQSKRTSYHESLPSRFSYGQHPNHSGYASVGKEYSE
ncbi:hypothetical protein ACEPAH_5288 [Sanghuangporus vaninii]